MATPKLKTGLKHRDVARDHFSSGKSQTIPSFSRLVITFIEGKSLLASDIETGKSDPVCFVWCGPMDETPDLHTSDNENSGILKTKVCPTTTDPIWNEDVVFPLEFNDINALSALKCLIYVRDEDISIDEEISYDELGMLEIPFKDIITKGKSLKSGIVLSAAWYTLKKSPGMRKVDGKIKLTINLVIHQNDFESLSSQLGLENTTSSSTSQASTNIVKAFQNVYKSTDTVDSRAESPSLRSSFSGQLPRPSTVSPTRSISASRQSDNGSLNSSRPNSASGSRSGSRERGRKNSSTAPLVKSTQRRPSTAPLISSIPENSSSTPSNRYSSYEDNLGEHFDMNETRDSENGDDVNMETITKKSAPLPSVQPKLLRPNFQNIHLPDSDEEDAVVAVENNDDEDDELIVIPAKKSSTNSKKLPQRMVDDSGTFILEQQNELIEEDDVDKSFEFEIQGGGDEGVMDELVKAGLKTATHLAKEAANELKIQNIVTNAAGAVASKLTNAKDVSNNIQSSLRNNAANGGGAVTNALKDLAKTVNTLNVPQMNFADLQKTAPAALKSAYTDSGRLVEKLSAQGGEMLQSITKAAGVGKAIKTAKDINNDAELFSAKETLAGGIGVAVGAKLNALKERGEDPVKETKRKSVEKTLIPPRNEDEKDENNEKKDEESDSDGIRTHIPNSGKDKLDNDSSRSVDKQDKTRQSVDKEPSPRSAVPVPSTQSLSEKPLKPAVALENKLDALLLDGPTRGDNAVADDFYEDETNENNSAEVVATEAKHTQKSVRGEVVKTQAVQKFKNKTKAENETGDNNDDDGVEELQKDDSPNNALTLTTKPLSPQTNSSVQGSATSVVRALKEMNQQRVEMERSIQELTRITQQGLQSLSDRISKMEQQQQQQQQSAAANNSNSRSLLDGPAGGGDEGILVDELDETTKNATQVGGRFKKILTKSMDKSKDGVKGTGAPNVKSKVSAVAAFKRDKKQQLNSQHYASTFGADREPHSKSPSRSASAAKFEPEISLVYRGGDGRIATNRVQSPTRNSGQYNKYDTSYEAYENVNRGENNRPPSPQKLQDNNYDHNNNGNYPNNNNNYSQQNGGYNQQQPPPQQSGINQLRNSYQQQYQGGGGQQPGGGLPLMDQKSTVNRDFCEVLDRGSLEDIAQLMECTGPRPELLSASTRNRLYDAIATLLYQNKHTERCLIWVLALVRGQENLLSTMVNHSKKDLLEALEKLSSEPSKKGLLASLLKSQINKQLSA